MCVITAKLAGFNRLIRKSLLFQRSQNYLLFRVCGEKALDRTSIQNTNWASAVVFRFQQLQQAVGGCNHFLLIGLQMFFPRLQAKSDCVESYQNDRQGSNIPISVEDSCAQASVKFSIRPKLQSMVLNELYLFFFFSKEEARRFD